MKKKKYVMNEHTFGGNWLGSIKECWKPEIGGQIPSGRHRGSVVIAIDRWKLAIGRSCPRYLR